MLQTKLEDSEKLHPVNLRSVDRKKVREKTAVVNSVINKIKTEDIWKMNTLILAGENMVAELIGTKKCTKKRGEPCWKRRILKQISELRKDISKLDQWKNNNLNSGNSKKRL